MRLLDGLEEGEVVQRQERHMQLQRRVRRAERERQLVCAVTAHSDKHRAPVVVRNCRRISGR
jgi:hypothetical protein